MSKVQAAPADSDPAWKRNNRNGPLDWWLGCRKHGADLSGEAHCLTCASAAEHNRAFAAKLALERVTDKVLAHKPKPKSKPARKRARRAKKIAQAADV